MLEWLLLVFSLSRFGYGIRIPQGGAVGAGRFFAASRATPPAAGRSHWRALTRKPPIRVLRWTSVIFRSLSMVCPVSMLTGSAASRGVAPGTGSCVGAGLRLGFVGFLRLLIDLRGDFAFRRWRRGDGGHGALYRRGLGGSRGCWKSTLTLLRLQLLQASVDGLAHMVLHVLQIREHNRNGIALGAFPAAITGQYGEGRRLRVRRGLAREVGRIAFAEGALRASGVHHVEIVAGHEDMLLAVREQALDAAGGGVRLAILGGDPGLVVFERNLLSHLIGDEVFHFGR